MGAYNVVSRTAMAAGQPEDISVVLANLDAIAAVLNGGLDNSNVNAAAALAIAKLAGYPADGTKFLAGDATWKLVSASQQLDYAETIANVTGIAVTTEATATAVLTSGAVVLDGATDVIIEAFIPSWQHDTNGAIISAALYDKLGAAAAASIGILTRQYVGVAANQPGGPWPLRRRLTTPAAGSHVYSVRVYVSSGNGRINATAGGIGVDMPAFIRVMKAA